MMMRTLLAERIKYHRTPALFLATVGPIGLGGLICLIYALNPGLHNAKPAGKWAWLLESLLLTWVLLFLPLGATIVAALATHLEHAENHLKHMLTLPPSRAAVYAAKLVAVFALVLLGSMVLTLVHAGLAVLIGAATPGPWWTAYGVALKAWVGLWPMLALGVWLGLRWRSFAVALSVGLAGTITGTLAIRSEAFWPYVPWTYPYMAMRDQALAYLLSSILTVVLIGLGMWDFSRRDIA